MITLSRRIFLFFFSILVFLALERLCNKAQAGFRVSKIYLKEAPSLDFTKNFSVEDLRKCQGALEQKYTYFAGGGECYVFESEDKKWVIKFFKNHHFTSLRWADAFPQPKVITKIIEKRRKLTKKFWQSCYYAITDLKSESELKFFQLNAPLLSNATITVIDKLNIAHKIELQKAPFALQPKLELFMPLLEKDIKEDKIKEAEIKIYGAIEAFAKLYLKGYRNWDAEIKRNLAWHENKAIFLDLGAFEKNKKCFTYADFYEDLRKATLRLDIKLKALSPSLWEYYLNTIEDWAKRLATIKATDSSCDILYSDSSKN